MQTRLIEIEPTDLKNKIILLDLNYTLVANSKQTKGPYPARIYKQTYEKELIKLIQNNTVILITARPYKYSYETLKHIKEETGFTPDDSYWNIGTWEDGMQPHRLKEYWLENAIFDKYGKDPKQYVAIESNKMTRKMYNDKGIYAIPKQDLDINVIPHPF